MVRITGKTPLQSTLCRGVFNDFLTKTKKNKEIILKRNREDDTIIILVGMCTVRYLGSLLIRKERN